MGSGKTTVGPLVAARLGWRFVDVDDVIEAEAGTTIAEIFARHGEAAFREREHATIARLASGDALVLALGGGAIEHAATRALLLPTEGFARLLRENHALCLELLAGMGLWVRHLVSEGFRQGILNPILSASFLCFFVVQMALHGTIAMLLTLHLR